MKSRSGLSLIEITLAIVIFATAIPTIGYIFGVAYQQESENSMLTEASFLAQALMDEISVRTFYESAGSPGNCVDTGEISSFDRRSFDDIDDYAIFSKDCGGTTKWGALSPPRDEAGNSLTQYSRFTQNVEVINVKAPTMGPTARTDYSAEPEGTTDFKLVTVTIGWQNGNRSVKLYKVFARHT